MSQTKQQIRTLIAGYKTSVSRNELEAENHSAIRALQIFEPFRSARTIGAYMPLPGEVDITPLFDDPLKIFYIPAFDPAAGIYRMARLTAELKTGRYGIPEPAVPDFADENEINLILIPGIAFDPAGRRIGRGGGFYDRLLPLYRTVRTGICFGFQCLPEIPAEDHDIRMDWLIHGEKIINCQMKH